MTAIGSKELILPETMHHVSQRVQRDIAFEAVRSRGTRGLRQYGAFFATFWLYGLLEPQRSQVIRSSYFWLRHIDDIADGDKPLPFRYPDRRTYLQTKKDLVEQIVVRRELPQYLEEREDILLVHYSDLAEKLGISLSSESKDILDTIIFDEERARLRKVPTLAELDEYFRQLDTACVAGALKVAGEKIPASSLNDLNRAIRVRFNLRDFPKDFKEGIINISQEEVEKYGVDLTRCQGMETVEQVINYFPMRGWYMDQLKEGRQALERAKVEIPKLHLKPTTNFSLRHSFIGPAEKTFHEYELLISRWGQPFNFMRLN